jgi:hypothetical protein
MRALALVLVLSAAEIERPSVAGPITEIAIGGAFQLAAAVLFVVSGDGQNASALFGVGLVPLLSGAIWLACALWARAQLE